MDNANYTEDSRVFVRSLPDSEHGIQRTAIVSPSYNCGNNSAVVLMSEHFGTMWCLQIRGFHQNANMKRGKRWSYAFATMKADDLRALRDACDAALKDIKAD